MPTQYRIIWKQPKSYNEKQTVWYATKEQAERMQDSLIRSGEIVIRIENREVK